MAFAVAVEGADRDVDAIATDLLVAAGGWQPAARTLADGGGRSAYDHKRSALVAEGELRDSAGRRCSQADEFNSLSGKRQGGRRPAVRQARKARRRHRCRRGVRDAEPSRPLRHGGPDGPMHFSMAGSVSTPGSRHRKARRVSQLSPSALPTSPRPSSWGRYPPGDAGAVAEERCLVVAISRISAGASRLMGPVTRQRCRPTLRGGTGPNLCLRSSCARRASHRARYAVLLEL